MWDVIVFQWCISGISGFSKQDYNYLIDLKFNTGNNWHETIKNAKFQKISCSILGDMTQ